MSLLSNWSRWTMGAGCVALVWALLVSSLAAQEPADKSPLPLPPPGDVPEKATPEDPTVELPAGDLPAKKQPTTPMGEVVPFQNPREFFDLRGIDASFLRFLTDGKDYAPDERETVYNLLASVPELAPLDLHAWRRGDVSWQQLADQPADYRLDAFRVPLRVKQVDVEPLPRATADKLEFKSYFRVQAELADRPGERVVLFARKVPKVWETKLIGQPMDEHALADAVFLKTGEKGQGELPLFYFVADRIGWLPDRPNKELAATPAWVALAKRGFDVSRFEDIRDRAKLGMQDREAFYQLLDAVSKIPAAELAAAAPAHSDLAPLVTKPDAVRGELATIQGRCRRATKVMVTDPDIQSRFGMKHYYELIVFLDEKVRFQQPDAPNKSVEFSSYPVVCCVVELPEQVPTNVEINEQLRVSGYYFKLYAYSSQFMQEEQQKQGLLTDMQLSPLLVGVRPDWIPSKAPETNPWVAAGIAGAVVVLIGLGAFGAWQYHSPAAEWAKKQTGPIGPPGEAKVPAEPVR